jgi:hypothetical protein
VSSVQTITSTEVLASTYGIECSFPSVSPPWLSNTTLAIVQIGAYYAYQANGPWTYICYAGSKFHRKKLYPVSTGGIVGISVGIGIPLVVFIVWFVHRRGNKKIEREVEKRRQARLQNGRSSGDGHELQERGHREAPPIYKEEGDGTVGESGSTGTGGADSAVRGGVGGGQRPPGYHEPHAIPKEDN